MWYLLCKDIRRRSAFTVLPSHHWLTLATWHFCLDEINILYGWLCSKEEWERVQTKTYTKRSILYRNSRVGVFVGFFFRSTFFNRHPSLFSLNITNSDIPLPAYSSAVRFHLYSLTSATPSQDSQPLVVSVTMIPNAAHLHMYLVTNRADCRVQPKVSFQSTIERKHAHEEKHQ